MFVIFYWNGDCVNGEHLREDTVMTQHGMQHNELRVRRETLGRRGFLRYASIGTGVALAAPALFMASSAVADTMTGAELPDLLRGGTYPVGFWWPPPPQQTTHDRYAEIAEAGFTFVTGGNGVQELPLNETMLNAAAANGLKAVIIDSRVSSIQNYPREQWPSVVASTVRDYEQFPAFSGILVSDEPSTGAFPQIGDVTDLVRRSDPRKLAYSNLLPTYATTDQLGAPTYPDYLKQYVAQVHPSFLSFDHYALFKPSGVRADYFHNWVLVRN
jgi:hypothetical protein